MPDEPTPQVVQDRTKKRFTLAIRLLAIVLIALVIGGLIARVSGTHQTTTDAYVTGHLHPIAARVTGTVLEVLVDDNQHVRTGDVLVRLDPADFRVQRRLAEAQIAEAIAQVAEAESQMMLARANIEASRATLEKTRLDLRRAKDLVGDKLRGISQQEYDAARAAHDTSRADIDVSLARLKGAEAQRAAALAQISSGEANRHQAELDIGYTEIRAPVSGYVGRKTVETGARISAGQTMMSVVADYVWVVANYKETQLGDIVVGAPATLSIDALDGKAFHGRVDSFSPATGAQFALLPPDNATGNFTKVVQRVPVKIRFHDPRFAPYRNRLFPGLSVIARIEIDRGDAPAGAGEGATPETSPEDPSVAPTGRRLTSR